MLVPRVRRCCTATSHVTTAALYPEIMGYAPTLVLKKLLAQTGLTPADIDTVELNEAFASHAPAVIRDVELDRLA